MRSLLAGLALAAVLAALPPLPRPLRLPPGMRQSLPLNSASSYFGDAVRIVDCPENKYAPFGTCGNVLFGGPAIFQTHLNGTLDFRFFPPINNISHFEALHPDNLFAGDTVMKAPQLYQMPVKENFVISAFGVVSSGDLNLNTGEVTNFQYSALFNNNFYAALVDVNPKLTPAAFRFPGIYGTAWAQFEQRDDGLLDFTMNGTTFLPLSNNIDGDPVRIPLPMCGATLHCASIEAPGSSLHPHIHLSTKAPDGPACGANCPDIPVNTIQIFPVTSAVSTVADIFNLNIPALGGNIGIAVTGVQGRVQVQFGERSGDTVPIIVSLLPPSGLLAKPPASPLDVLGVTPGLFGHDLDVNFPKASYHVNQVVMEDDPLDFSIGAVDLKTGKVIGPLLYRGFFIQSLLLAILDQNNGRIAPASFTYRGPAQFENGANGQMLFRYDSGVFIPYADFTWPAPDLDRAKAFVAGPDSELNPLMRIQAARPRTTPSITKTGSGTGLVSTIGDRYSYSFSVGCDGSGSPSFQFTNDSATSRGGTFRMENLASVTCSNSRGSALGDFDIVTFAGYGTWSKDSDRHLATVQAQFTPGSPFISIQIDGGLLSNASMAVSLEKGP